MGFIIGLVIGLLTGAAIAYFLTSRKSTSQAASIQDLKRQLDLAESEHERRLREATKRLQRDYGTQLQAAQAQATQSVRSAPTPPKSVAAPPPVGTLPTEPLPEPATAPPEPEVAAPPVTATAPAPIPQPVAQSPDIPETASNKALPSSTPPSASTDPNALLAASYAPDATTRAEVAQAIAAILPTTGLKEQTRWFPLLGRLARDPDPQVRLQAVHALAYVKSSKRLPLLNRALRDTDSAVVGAASAILAQSKGRSRPQASPQKRRLPKNK